MQNVFSRIQSHWQLKMYGGAVLIAFLMGGYFAIEHLPGLHPHAIAETAIDRAIGFSPEWVGVYASFYLFPVLALLIQNREDLHRYFVGFITICTISFICFILWPIELPRPGHTSIFLYQVITTIDAPTNCLPSLHLALSTFTACALVASATGFLRTLFTVLLPPWVLLIAYSTMATKQHYFIDVVSGIVLGLAAQWFFWRKSNGLEPAGKEA